MRKERNRVGQRAKIETLFSTLSVIAGMVAGACFVPSPAQAQTAAPAEQRAAPALPAIIPTDARRSSILTMGHLAGHQAVWTTPDGKLHAPVPDGMDTRYRQSFAKM